ncbi:hypothetical protein ABZ297_18425, partial [Nonomuraea sp. NPDC005983]
MTKSSGGRAELHQRARPALPGGVTLPPAGPKGARRLTGSTQKDLAGAVLGRIVRPKGGQVRWRAREEGLVAAYERLAALQNRVALAERQDERVRP